MGADHPDYWRITALDEYRSAAGGQWSLTAEGDDAVGKGLDGPVPAGALVQRYRIGPLSERWMPAAYRAVRVNRPDTLVVRSSTTLVTGRPSVEGLDYSVASARPLAGSTRRRAARRWRGAADLRRYTELPADLPPVVAQTAATVTGSSRTRSTRRRRCATSSVTGRSPTTRGARRRRRGRGVDVPS